MALNISASQQIGSTIEYGELGADVLYRLVPIGTVLLWLKNYASTPALPAGYLEANGQIVADADSPFNGQALPDLRNKFPRMEATSENTGGSDTHQHTLPNTGLQNANGDQSCTRGTITTNAGSTLPAYYSVVPIIRIK